MKRNNSFILLTVVLFSIVGLTSLQAREVFVKPNASGTGASWSDAANISFITGTAVADGDIVYLAEGEYLRSTQLSVTKYITLMGGYSATSTETDLTQRDIQNFKTIFKPDGGSSSRAININISNGSGGAKMIVEGIHFEGFNGVSQGAAMIITTCQGDVDLKNLTYKNNTVTNSLGGALAMPTAFSAEITITLDGCHFEGNQANFTTGNGYGGAFFFNNTTAAKTINIKNSVFKGNYAYGRGAAGYFGTNLTVNVSDCTFDSNQCTASTDNLSNGGCFYIVGTAGYGSTFNVTRSVFLNSYITGKGSVIWFNNTSGSLINYLNMSQCSLIGNYSSRTTSGRAAIDVDNYSTQLQFTLNGCVLSNYNNIGQVKSSRYADVMFVSQANSTNACTFTNSILNGTYFSTGNVLASISAPDTLYNKQRGYLADSTINLALSGELVITDKIELKKVFIPAQTGQWVDAQIFDIKKKMNLQMILNATIPTGYKLIVDAQDYPAGDVSIKIPAGTADPVIILSTLSATNQLLNPLAKVLTNNGVVSLSEMEPGSKVVVYNQAGQIILQKDIKTDRLDFEGNGFMLVKIANQAGTQVLKVLSH